MLVWDFWALGFAATISNKFTEADPQISRLGVSCVPTADTYGVGTRGGYRHTADARLTAESSR